MKYVIGNSIIEIYSLVVMIILLLSQLIRKNNKIQTNKILFILMINHAAVLLIDSIDWIVDGTPGRFMYYFGWIINSLVFIGSMLTIYIFIVYVMQFIPINENRKKRLLLAPKIIVCIYFILLFTSPWTHFLFYMNDENFFTIGKIYFSSYIFSIIIYFMTACILIYYKKEIGKKQVLVFYIYFITNDIYYNKLFLL